MRDINIIDPRGAATMQSDFPAANTAAVVTLAADPEQVHVLDRLEFSYDGAPTGGSITVAIGGSTVFQHTITAGGPGQFTFDNAPLYGGLNASMVITLAAGGAGVVGKLTARTR